MKTATVRDLRNRFADVAKWIDAGEEITITRHGKSYATLQPAKVETRRTVDWTKSAMIQGRVSGKRKLTQKETQEFYRDMRGRY